MHAFNLFQLAQNIERTEIKKNKTRFILHCFCSFYFHFVLQPCLDGNEMKESVRFTYLSFLSFSFIATAARSTLERR